MVRVTFRGQKHLPSHIPADGMCLATEEVCKLLGVKGTILVRVTSRRSKCRGCVTIHGRRNYTIDLYCREMLRQVKEEGGSEIFYMLSDDALLIRWYGDTLVHELVHISQAQRGSKGLTVKLAEEEAKEMENVYGPVAWRILMGEAARPLAEKELEANG